MAGTILAAILATALRCEGDLWSFATSAPLVVLLWYWVGLWIDGRLGYAGIQHGRIHYPHFFANVGFGFSVLAVFISAIMLLHATFHRGNRVDEFLVGSCFTCWSVFLLAATSSNLRRRGASESAKRPLPT
jgi:hypothetical protein